MTKEEYAKAALDLAYQYEEDVLSGKEVANNWIRAAVKRRRRLAEKYYLNEEGALDVFRFMYYINITIKGKLDRFRLMPFQAWIILSIYGISRDEKGEYRLTTEAIIFISRKCGKSSLSAVLGLYDLLKGERNPEVYVAASTKEQASLILKMWKQILQDSPAIAKRAKPMQYKIISRHNGDGIAKSLVNEPDRLLGSNPSMYIIDEASILQGKELYNALQTGTVYRKNPLGIQITTASWFKDYYFYNDYMIGKRVLEGEIENDTVFYALYELDEDDDVEDYTKWKKAMPAMGYLIDLETMKVKWKKAKLTTTDKNEFLNKNLNKWSDNATTWIPDDAYRQCFINPDLEALKGQPAYLGLDLSTTRDLASLVVVVENPETKKLEVFPEFYFPTEDNDYNKVRKSGIDLTAWIDKGYIMPHKNKVVDYEEILKRIKYYNEIFDLQGLSYDAWSSSVLISKIEAEVLIDVYAAPQTTSYFNAPLKYLERQIFNKGINLSKNPVLRWNFRNVVIYADGNNNIKIMKNKSRDSVDGAVALAMAVGLYMKLNWDAIAMIMEDFSKSDIELDKKEV